MKETLFSEKKSVAELLAEKRELEKQLQARDRQIAEFKKQQRHYHRLFDSSPLGIIVADTEGNILQVNSAMLKILGSPSVEATKAINILTFPPLVEAGISDAIRRCLEDGDSLTIEYSYTSKWGKQVFIRLHTVPIYDEEGNIIQAEGMLEDISKQKEMELTLQESERRYRFLTENINDVIWTVDFETKKLLYISPACERIFGYTAEEILSQPLAERMPPKSLELVMDFFRNFYKQVPDSDPSENPVASLEIEQYHKNGHRIWVEIRQQLLRDEEGRPKMILGVSRDITERKKTEKILRRRTAELKKQNEELKAYSYTVAHDLKTPLSAIIGFSKLLSYQFDSISAEQREYLLNRIVQVGQKMTNIIDELLLLAHVRDVQEIERTKLDMRELIHNVLARLEHEIEHYRATITFSEKARWIPVIGYAPWVEEVWVNYLTNAMKYGGNHPKVIIGCCEIEQEEDFPPPPLHHPDFGTNEFYAFSSSTDLIPANSFVRYWVRDFGKGLSIKEQQKLFTPFERLHRISKGNGLGLAITERIIKKLGGQVGVYSRVKKGSIFWFELPRAD